MRHFIRFDSVGGASGDMILAALAALGADLRAVEKALNRFFPERLHFHVETAAAAGLHGLRVAVYAEGCADAAGEAVWPDAAPEPSAGGHGHGHEHGHAPGCGHVHEHSRGHGHAHAHGGGHAHRGLEEIERLLTGSPLSEPVRRLSLDVFCRLAEAEAKIHGTTPERVRFHEVGAWDSVADIVGACLALEQLGVCGVACGPLPAGAGTIRCAHGEMPNPAPATLELLAGMAVVQTDEPYELVTPTGAALLRVWTHGLEPLPAVATVMRSAFGFGRRELRGRPNVLRATLLAAAAAPEGGGAAAPGAGEELLVLETNLDDCNPEWIGALAADLLERGALDVWHAPVVMKKGRPGTVLSVLSPAAGAAALRERIFRATTTFGIRYYPVRREALERRFEAAPTPWGEVPVKVGSLRGEDLTAAPEYEACAALARANGLAPRQVDEAARLSAALRARSAGAVGRPGSGA